MSTIAPTVAPLPAPVAAAWPQNITTTESLVLGLLPVASLVLIYVLLRLVWKVPTPLPRYRAIPDETTSLKTIEQTKTSLVEEGEVAGDYEESWLKTFDFVFLLGMTFYFVVMFILTCPSWA
ncbi:hypothetical protein ATCC90586_009612 [Pythium insidiosum]|nr:hypothetical protein ATCC90586_009612 [Pythium insidiosum]